MLRWFEVNTNIWIWETIHAWIVFQISQKLCLRMLWPEMRLAPAHCHLAKRGAIWRSCENIMTVFDSVFSASYIQLRLSQVTFVVSLFVILPMYQHYVDENQMLTLHLNHFKKNTSLTVFVKRHIILNKWFKVPSVIENIPDRFPPVLQMVASMAIQLISQGAKQTVPSHNNEISTVKDVRISKHL